MKKLKAFAALLFMLLCCSFDASAHLTWWNGSKPENSKITLRGEVGLNLSHFTHADRWDDIKAGVNAGVIAEFPILNSLSAKAGIFYTLKGTTGKNDGGFGGTLKTTWSASYLEIPVLASYRLQINDAYRVQFDFGPYFAYGLGGKQIHKYSGSTVANDSNDKSPTFTKYLKRFDLGLRFGPEFVFRDKLAVALNYEVSVINISNMGGKVGFGNLMLNFSYSFYSF